MELPNLPTDSLYKFIAFTGILFVFIFFIYPLTRIDKIKNERILLIADTANLRVSVEILLSKDKIIDKKIGMLDKTKKERCRNVDSLNNRDTKFIFDIEKFSKNLHNKEYRDYLKFLFDYENQIFPEKLEIKEIMNMMDLNNDFYNKILIKQADISSKKFQINEKLKQENKWLWIDIIGVAIGLILIYFGFKLWYTRIQSPLDQKLQLEVKIAEQNIKNLT